MRLSIEHSILKDPVQLMDEKECEGESYPEGWGFWDETRSHWYGGYETEKEARKMLRRYCEEVLGG